MFRQKKCIVDNLNKDFVHDLTFAALLKYTQKKKSCYQKPITGLTQWPKNTFRECKINLMGLHPLLEASMGDEDHNKSGSREMEGGNIIPCSIFSCQNPKCTILFCLYLPYSHHTTQ